MSHNRQTSRQQIGNGRIERRRRRLDVLFSTEVADDIHHTDFSDAPAIVDETLVGDGLEVVAVVAVPNADVGFAGGFEYGEGVADGGGDGE